jgi:hypothetical protein
MLIHYWLWSLNTLSGVEPADWWLGADTAMRAMPIVTVQPDWQFGGSFSEALYALA